jgi:predicted glycosyltransferase
MISCHIFDSATERTDMVNVLKNHLIQALDHEKKKKKPDPIIVKALAFAAAKEELSLSISYVENMSPDAVIGIRSALDLLGEAVE